MIGYPFEVVHFDVLSPCPIEPKSGFWYFVTIMDGYSWISSPCTNTYSNILIHNTEEKLHNAVLFLFLRAHLCCFAASTGSQCLCQTFNGGATSLASESNIQNWVSFKVLVNLPLQQLLYVIPQIFILLHAMHQKLKLQNWLCYCSGKWQAISKAYLIEYFKAD